MAPANDAMERKRKSPKDTAEAREGQEASITQTRHPGSHDRRPAGLPASGV